MKQSVRGGGHVARAMVRAVVRVVVVWVVVRVVRMVAVVLVINRHPNTMMMMMICNTLSTATA
jgi:hypothetical protein